MKSPVSFLTRYALNEQKNKYQRYSFFFFFKGLLITGTEIGKQAHGTVGKDESVILMIKQPVIMDTFKYT